MIKRREFISKSMTGTAAIAIGGIGFSAKSYSSIVGANELINIGIIGIGGRGSAHVGAYCALKDSKNVRIKTICDVDETTYAQRLKTIETRTGTRPRTEWDLRKVLDDKEIQAVSYATPNFWHALGTIWAAQAGKHVYVEKPACWSLWEGRKMVEAARKYKVRVQVGHQSRSDEEIKEAIRFIHNGGIGDVFMARGTCIKPRDSFGIAPDSNPPATLHYDQWLGPVEWRPYNEKKGHYNWHWFWATGNGDTGNQGPHQFDIARWGMQKEEHPVQISSVGGVFGIDPKECAQETPNTQTSIFKYNDGKVLEFETRGRYSNAEGSLGITIGNIFFGTEGYLELGDGWRAFRKREKEPFAQNKARKRVEDDLTGGEETEHFANFIDAVRSGKDSDLACDVLTGHMSAALPHLANISHRLGRGLEFNGTTEKFVNDPEADKMLRNREYRYPFVINEKV
jgi:predicted dehydrogenase